VTVAELPEAWKPENLPARPIVQLPKSDCPRDPKLIGSSDIACIVGFYDPALAYLGKARNAADLYLRCVHGVEQPKPPSRVQLDRGLKAEDPLRDLYRKTVGAVSDPLGVIMHPRFPWACASPDGLTRGGIAEFKTHSKFHMEQWGDSGTDQVPDKYNLQVQWQMGIAGRSWAHVLVGFGIDRKDDAGEPYFEWTETRVYDLDFDAELFATCEQQALRFFTEHVSAKRPPALKPVHNRRRWKALTNGAGY
jgi:putative phage-type endonuclease